ncbi:hypothetical protein BDR04DRAFT_1157958 [Suillus decipiens]|nr:hypothetical protein BDR04DRAFT_1157958 [Suillus decipiens]
MSRKYTCSAEPGCKQTFTKFTELKRHEAAHSAQAYTCTWPGCNFATLLKKSYDIHCDKHAEEQRWICPHDDCDYKTHDPSCLTRHRKTKHGHVPSARSGDMQPQPTPSRPTQSHSTQHQTPLTVYSQSLGVLYGSIDTADDYTMFTGAEKASNGWSEGCMCPELMERRPSEMLGYDYRHY